MSRKTALIIGCGIAGPAAALFLKRAGFEPIVFEALPEPDDYTGLFLNMARNGLKILDQLKVGEAIRQEGIAMHRMRFQSGYGKWLGEVGQLEGEPQGYTVKRGFLHKVLREAAEGQGIPVHFGKRLVDVRLEPHQVTACFADGTSAQGHVLVGCDGIHSKTRQVILPDANQPDYTGLISFGGFAISSSIPFEPGTQHMVFGRKAFFGYMGKPNGEIYWFGNLDYPGQPTRKALMAIPQEEWRNKMIDLYRDDPQPILEIIRNTISEIGVYPIYDMLYQPKWYQGRAVLIGDAIHATSPNAGQGASLALEDAMLLAICLRDKEEVGEALATFQSLRRQRVEQIVRYSRKIGQHKQAKNRIQVFFRDLLLPLFLKAASRASNEWLYDYRLDWNQKISG